jgi:hypothetical protein
MDLRGWNGYGLIICVKFHRSLTLREEKRLRVFENRVLRRIFGSKRDEATGEWEDYITRDLMTCTHHQILFG